MFAAALAAFITIFVAEFGDKTQLVSMCMACRYPPLQVLAGAMAALAVVIGLAVLVGGFLSAYIPHTLVAVLSGIVFIVIGIFSYFKKEDNTEECNSRDGFFQTMALVFVAEFGDKTQVAAMFLTASLGYPLAVFAGAMAAMFCNHLIAVYLGSRFISKIDARYLKIGTAVLFIVIGLLIIILEALPK
ncbi:MAG: TMEM165/GDT1 family protein [Bacillota bacterium]|nr:TMEM165/GDT1 family protein [Bacillota bacterium]